MNTFVEDITFKHLLMNKKSFNNNKTGEFTLALPIGSGQGPEIEESRQTLQKFKSRKSA